ncbi:hypothetical protein L1887_30883 [Cichorium endivia]|nr:hypothetical protein L1887_30883 [Cichorium endivia]
MEIRNRPAPPSSQKRCEKSINRCLLNNASLPNYCVCLIVSFASLARVDQEPVLEFKIKDAIEKGIAEKVVRDGGIGAPTGCNEGIDAPTGCNEGIETRILVRNGEIEARRQRMGAGIEVRRRCNVGA